MHKKAILTAISKHSLAMQGELSEAVKTLDLGVQAAQSEFDLASEAAAKPIFLRLVVRPEPRSTASAKAVGSLKNSPLMQRLHAQKAQSSADADPTPAQVTK